jgi:hypothetical protein
MLNYNISLLLLLLSCILIPLSLNLISLHCEIYFRIAPKAQPYLLHRITQHHRSFFSIINSVFVCLIQKATRVTGAWRLRRPCKAKPCRHSHATQGTEVGRQATCTSFCCFQWRHLSGRRNSRDVIETIWSSSVTWMVIQYDSIALLWTR